MKRISGFVAAVLAGCLLLTGCFEKKQQSTLTTTVGFATTVTASFTTDTMVSTTQTAVTSGSATSTEKSATSVTTKTIKKKTTTTAAKKTTTTAKPTTGTTASPPVSVTGERRAVWVSYIELNTLLKPCSTAAQGKAVIDGLMDTASANRMNTVFFHVRANSDAYYQSSIFKYASSAKKLLNVGFDPLAYAVEAAHKRGMELHAWVNPYRVGKDASYIVKGQSTFQDAKDRYYYIPTSASAQKLILDGIRELLNNYAIDGVQYDDYFYPEGLLEENTVYDFEKAGYDAYCADGGTLSVGNWRRAGVDALVAGTHALTKAKGKVFGISPSHDAAKTYNKMFADSKKWLAQSGYVDYLCPQIYFGFDHASSAFDKMTDTWLSYPRDKAVSLYVGIATYKIGLKEDTWAGANGKTEWAKHDDILKRSVQYLRSKGINGLCFYSFSHFTPETCNVDSFQTKNDVEIAKQEIKNLLSIL